MKLYLAAQVRAVILHPVIPYPLSRSVDSRIRLFANSLIRPVPAVLHKFKGAYESMNISRPQKDQNLT